MRSPVVKIVAVSLQHLGFSLSQRSVMHRSLVSVCYHINTALSSKYFQRIKHIEVTHSAEQLPSVEGLKEMQRE